MNKHMHLHTLLLLGLIMLPAIGSAQEEEEKLQSITIADQTFEYTEVFEDVQDITSYYRDEVLVLSVQDINNDGAPDVWVVYHDDLSIAKELRDTDRDGVPDIFIDFDADENVTDMSGEGLKQFEKPASSTEVFTPKTETDYAGNLEDIEKLAGEKGGFSFWLFLLLILLGVGTWWKYKRPVT